MNKTFLAPDAWGRVLNERAKGQNQKSHEGIAADLNKEGIFKDIRDAEDFEKGVSATSKYSSGSTPAAAASPKKTGKK